MKLNYFQGNIPNFGDDLNPYIFQNLFPNLFSREDDLNFYGIGSILDDRIDGKIKNIIFGTGIRGIQKTYPSQNWDLRFVRGPISAQVLKCKYIADGAYCLPLLPKELFNYKGISKKFKYSFMPYFRQLDNVALLKSFTDHGINIISPVDPLQKVIEDIASTEFLICGAMHGAIVADICRVPWTRFVYGMHGYESKLISELKWTDWAGSIDLDVDKYIEIYPPNILSKSNKVLKKIDAYYNSILLYKNLKGRYNNQNLYQLSKDSVMDRIISELNEEVDALNKKYAHYI